MANCKICNTEITLSYCANCGQPSSLKRIDSHYIVHEIEHLVHFERGLMYTVRELLLRPGQNIRNYLYENRSRLVKPVIFIIITSLLYTLANNFFLPGTVNTPAGETKMPASAIIFKWVREHYGYANIIMGLFIAIWTKVFFRKYNYNFFEILILLCFIMGMGMLILAIFSVISGLIHINLMQITGYLGIGYCAWAIGQFFEGKKAINYLYALCAYILGMVTFFALAIALGKLIDIIKA